MAIIQKGSQAAGTRTTAREPYVPSWYQHAEGQTDSRRACPTAQAAQLLLQIGNLLH